MNIVFAINACKERGVPVCFAGLVAGFIFTHTTSCKDPLVSAFHPHYFDSVLNNADSIYEVDREKGIRYLHAAYNEFPDPGIGDRCEKYNRLADYYIDGKKDIAGSISFADSTIYLLSSHTSNKRFARLCAAAYFKKGNGYFQMHQYDDAINNYNLAKLLITDKLKDDSCELRTYYESLANLFFVQANNEKALPYFKNNLLLAESCLTGFRQFAYVQGNLDNIGLCYQGLNLGDSAFFYYQAALRYIEQHENNFSDKRQYISSARMIVYNNIAAYAFLHNNMKMAEETLLKAIDIIEKYDQPRDIAYLRVLLSQTYQTINQPEKSFQFLKLAEPYFNELRYEDTFAWFYQVSSSYYRMVKDSGQALLALSKSILINDSIARRDKQFASLDIKKEFQYREQNILNNLLKKDNEVKNVYLVIAVITSLMAVAIIVLIWSNLRRSARHVRSLKQLNEEISQKNDDLHETLLSLEQSHEENNRIIRVIAHDLKNPIGGIKILARVLLRQSWPESSKEMINIIETTCSNSLVMIDELITQKKNIAEYRKEWVDMVKLLTYSVELLQTKASEKNQRLLLQAESATLFVNRQKIWRVISNIVTNAIKFSPENSDININLQNRKENILLSVQDRGIGIPDEFNDSIFLYNSGVSRPGTSGEQSHGIGLSISKKIVEEHEGKLWYESRMGTGTVFYVELPVLQAN